LKALTSQRTAPKRLPPTPKMATDLIQAHQALWQWCRSHNFAGYDPYDGLNSAVFQATPLRDSRLARLAWTQVFKRSPINFRKLAGIPLERNSKGVALFSLGALANYRREATKENEIEARELVDDLIGMSLKGFKGAAWGYNFDWQARAFFAPRGTPAIVPTAFAARALVEASVVLDNDDYLNFARTICDFILNDLNRSEEVKDEVCFSYSPVDRTHVFNASLLAGEVLASVGKLSKEESLCRWALRAARYVVRRQRADGSWSYGTDDYQSWTDNFHSAFILTSLSRIIDACESARDELEPGLMRGYEFWEERFFLSNGWPKYYPDSLYPADVHSTAAAIVALVDLRGRVPGALDHAGKVASWAIENLRDRRGFFYYQRHRFHTVRIAYMRWSQAWMAYALARLREAKQNR
jgi:hypothetical protein